MWSVVSEENKKGVAIHNFLPDGSQLHGLTLYVGDEVLLLEETDDWYLGCTLVNLSKLGVFPKCYISIKSLSDDDESPLIEEATTTLREWGLHLKDLFVRRDKKFEIMKQMLYDLMELRSKILSGTLPNDELKTIEHQLAEKIDLGNFVLGLDMVVRDANCRILDPDKTSTVQMFRKYKEALEKIKKSEKAKEQKGGIVSKPLTDTGQHCHSLLVSVNNFICKVGDETELLISLYDGKELVPFTENYVVRWTYSNPLLSLRALFTDLGNKDLNREKVYFVCYVIRLGALETKESEKETIRASLQGANGFKKQPQYVRRPFGLVIKDISSFMTLTTETVNRDEDEDIDIPFTPCEKESLEQTLKKTLMNKDGIPKEDPKGQKLWVKLKMLHGDLKHVREENPHLLLGNTAIARKMGFPEVILPGDVRNDLYLTLLSGDFSRSKNSEKNIQVLVSVCDENGIPIPEVIFLGAGVPGVTEFKSVVYYHDDKPKWNEIFKIAVPIEDFKRAHVKFLFKHRSSNEAKDKAEKPFAMSFVKLMQNNGTTLNNTQHQLCVYRIEPKRFDEADTSYLQLVWSKTEVDSKKDYRCPGLSLSHKDNFWISTNICSTKLTQNVDLLGLLNWADHKGSLEQNLNALMNVNGEEVVKYMQDVLDALFTILMQNPDSELYDDIVFKCLIFIIGLIDDKKYRNFQAVLNVYIEESFSATLAYNKLIVVWKTLIKKSFMPNADTDLAYKAMSSMQYLFKFIVRSRLLFAKLNEDKGQEQFEIQLRRLLEVLVELIRQESSNLLRVQGACLKFFPRTINDLITVFDSRELSNIVARLIDGVPSHKLINQKILSINEIIKGELFLKPDARDILLPCFLNHLKVHLENHEEARGFYHQSKSAEKLSRVLGACGAPWGWPTNLKQTELDLCTQVLSDIMDLLFRKDIGPTFNDVSSVMFKILRTVIQSVIKFNAEAATKPKVSNMVVIMLSIFREISKQHFEAYMANFQYNCDRLDFLAEILILFKELISLPVFPKDWCEMILLQNCIILKSLTFFSRTIRENFLDPFEWQIWRNFFFCAIGFLTQPGLQLDLFSQNKRNRILNKYKDMRLLTVSEICTMWYSLGQFRIRFVPELVGLILEMTLINEPKLRKDTIPIFFDMMQCEFYSSRDSSEFNFAKRDSTSNKGNFNKFEKEMIEKLDVHFEGGLGDEEYKNLFNEIMLSLCENHQSFKIHGVKFVKTVTRLMARLLEYRLIIKDENKENKMSCVVNLLDFYSEINRREMYLRYVYKLCELHLDCENFTEAAFTLQLHSTLLQWSEEPLSVPLQSQKYSSFKSHVELKEHLYHQCIDLFDRGKMWERALILCNELRDQYERFLFDYHKLSRLYKKMADFYEAIMKQMRPVPEYFRVGFYGRGFPPFLQNREFIYRGKDYERLSDFNGRILNQFPQGEIMNTLKPPDKTISESTNQYIQINKVDPIMESKSGITSDCRANEQILRYYRVNDVQKFQYSRPVYQDGGSSEFGNLGLERTVLRTSYPLPGILMWFPITDNRTILLSPIENAIETVNQSNLKLIQLVNSYLEGTQPVALHQLTMKLNGIIDAAVMGGISNYEKAFFTIDYEQSHPDHSKFIKELQRAIAEQIPILELALEIHKKNLTSEVQPLHDRLETCFAEMKEHIESKYGRVNPQEINLRNSAHVIKRYYSTNSVSSSVEPRHSVASLSAENNLSPSKQFTTNTIKKEKLKEKRKSKTGSKDGSSLSQWYLHESEAAGEKSLANQPIIELRQDLHPRRPLRSEVEKERRLSRPCSSQPWYMVNRLSQGSGQSGSRDSTGTTGSTNSEEDSVPPPLPVKQRDSDYGKSSS